MNAIKTILNVLGVLAAIPVALILSTWLLCAPLLSAMTWCVQPDNVRQIIQEIDYDAILDETTAETPQLEAFMKTETVAELVKLYAEDMFAQFEGEPAGTRLNIAAVRASVEAHTEELLPIFRDLLKQEADSDINVDDITDEDIKKLMMKVVDEEIPALLDELPTASEMGMDDPEVQKMMTSLREGLLAKLGVALAVFLSVVLFLLRIYRLRGFVWLSVVYFITGGLNLLSGQSVALALPLMEEEAASFAEPLLKLIGEQMTQSGIIYGVVAIVCVVLSVVFHNYLMKRSMPRPENVGPELY